MEASKGGLSNATMQPHQHGTQNAAWELVWLSRPARGEVMLPLPGSARHFALPYMATCGHTCPHTHNQRRASSTRQSWEGLKRPFVVTNNSRHAAVVQSRYWWAVVGAAIQQPGQQTKYVTGYLSHRFPEHDSHVRFMHSLHRLGSRLQCREESVVTGGGPNLDIVLLHTLLQQRLERNIVNIKVNARVVSTWTIFHTPQHRCSGCEPCRTKSAH